MKTVWDQTGARKYETGVDQAVLFVMDDAGVYGKGEAWNGLISVNEKPSGGEATAKYANNKKYLNLVAAEQFGCTIEAFTYPDGWEQCDGIAELANGITIGQQRRHTFALCYRTLVGNDVEGDSFGAKYHFMWGGLAKPSEKPHTTVNESPEAATMSWEVTTTAIDVEGFKPTASLTVDTTTLTEAQLAKLPDLLDLVYGTDGTPGTDAKMPTPAEIVAVFA